MHPGCPRGSYRLVHSASTAALPVAPLRFDTSAGQRCGAGLLAVGSAPMRLSAALLGSLFLMPAAEASPAAGEVPGRAMALGGAVRLRTGGEGPLSPAAAPSPEPGVLLPAGRSSGKGPDPVRPAATARARELVLDRRRRRLVVLENGRPVRRFPVAVGMPGWETPVGRFTVLEKQTNPVWEHPVSGVRIQPGPDNPLGSRWIGFYRDCAGRRGFNVQEHLVVQGCVVAGFHGTPNRASIGRAASHGCVRLYDEHVRDLFDLVRVGTPVTVLP